MSRVLKLVSVEYCVDCWLSGGHSLTDTVVQENSEEGKIVMF